MTPPPALDRVASLRRALDGFGAQAGRLEGWAATLVGVWRRGGRLLAAGNGGSAAEAQHLTAELVGRFVEDRQPFSAIALHAETSSLTAITNDYGADDAFARQVHAHGRPGDVLVVLSTSGRSSNLLAAVTAARQAGVTSWALTGGRPNPLADACDDGLAVEADAASTVQEVHLLAVHVLCAEVERRLGASTPAPAEAVASIGWSREGAAR